MAFEDVQGRNSYFDQTKVFISLEDENGLTTVQCFDVLSDSRNRSNYFFQQFPNILRLEGSYNFEFGAQGVLLLWQKNNLNPQNIIMSCFFQDTIGETGMCERLDEGTFNFEKTNSKKEHVSCGKIEEIQDPETLEKMKRLCDVPGP